MVDMESYLAFLGSDVEITEYVESSLGKEPVKDRVIEDILNIGEVCEGRVNDKAPTISKTSADLLMGSKILERSERGYRLTERGKKVYETLKRKIDGETVETFRGLLQESLLF
jgi:hypothetical protein